MSRCHDKRHSTEGRVNGERKQVHVYTCIPHQIYGKEFESKAARERFIEQHHEETSDA